MSEYDAELDDLIARYLDLTDDGAVVDVDHFIADYPESLRQAFLEFVQLEDGLQRLNELGGIPQQRNGVEQTVGNYRLLRKISHGGMGIVYVGEDIESGDLVAIKLLRRAIRNEQTYRRRLERESRAIAALKHPHVVQPISSGIGAGATYFAMELIDGVSLDRVIQHWQKEAAQQDHETPPLGEQETVTTPITHADIGSCASFFGSNRLTKIAELLANIADALHVAHESGIVHRDVKPSNILIDVDGNIWLTDFGLASIGDDENDLTLTATGEVLGTPAYMSPEQATGQRSEIDRSSDIYSLGATLYELATLRRPYSGPREKIIQDLLSGRYKAPSKVQPEVPAELEAIISHAMELHRRDRYATAQDFAADLRRFATHARVHAPIRGPIYAALRWCVRNPRTTMLAVGGCVLIAMVAISVQTLNSWSLSRLNDELNITNERLIGVNRDLDASQERLKRELYAANLSSAFEAYNDRDLLSIKKQLQPYGPSQTDVARPLPQRLLEALTESPLSTVICQHEGPATQFVIAEDDSFILSAGHDGQVSQSTLDGKLLKTFKTGGKLDSLAIDPRSRTFVTGKNLPFGYNGVDCHSLEDGKVVHQGVKLWYGVEEVTVSPSGAWYAAAERYNDVVVFAKGGEVRARWNTCTRNESLEFIDDDRLLCIGELDDGPRSLYLWDLKTDEKKRIIENVYKFCVSRNADGEPVWVIGAGSDDVQMLHWESENCTPFLIDSASRIRCIDIRGEDFTAVAGCDDGTVYVWESIRDWTHPPAPDRVVKVSDQRITDVQLLPLVASPVDSKTAALPNTIPRVRFITSSEDGTVQLHSMPDRNPIVPPGLTAVYRVELDDPFRDPQRDHLVYLPYENGKLVCLDVETLDATTIYQHDELIYRGVCSGDRIYITSPRGVFDIDRSNGQASRHWEYSGSQSRSKAMLIVDDTLYILYSTQLVAIPLSGEGKPKVTKLSYHDGLLLAKSEKPEVRLLIYTYRALLELGTDGHINVRHLTESIKDGYMRVLYSQDREMLAIARNTDEIEVTYRSTGITRTLSGHRQGMTSLELIDNDTALMSVSADRTIRFWHLETERELGRLELGKHCPNHALYFPNQNAIVTTHSSGEVKVWRVAEQ
ncbi:serine/threonine-protein kinase [Blastopirellula marina]|uniref:Protein kinase domain-containing protein n=1 Tax=Blastopirellula marina TaxID=124 RepID=A0A2S8GRC7_9BACT|nr:serine/threonine-protein kinase [Blastopirellula marina]PQO46988.1 hypothetical protein C5Y93_05685 [Blastopirellula marina]